MVSKLRSRLSVLQARPTLAHLLQPGQFCCCKVAALVATVASHTVRSLCWCKSSMSGQVVPCDSSAEQDIPLRELYGESPCSMMAVRCKHSQTIPAARGIQSNTRDEPMTHIVHSVETDSGVEYLSNSGSKETYCEGRELVAMTQNRAGTELPSVNCKHVEHASPMAAWQYTQNSQFFQLQRQICMLQTQKVVLLAKVQSLHQQLAQYQSHASLQASASKDLMYELMCEREAIDAMSNSTIVFRPSSLHHLRSNVHHVRGCR